MWCLNELSCARHVFATALVVCRSTHKNYAHMHTCATVHTHKHTHTRTRTSHAHAHAHTQASLERQLASLTNANSKLKVLYGLLLSALLKVLYGQDCVKRRGRSRIMGTQGGINGG